VDKGEGETEVMGKTQSEWEDRGENPGGFQETRCVREGIINRIRF
jgi:hypothetical protein